MFGYLLTFLNGLQRTQSGVLRNSAIKIEERSHRRACNFKNINMEPKAWKLLRLASYKERTKKDRQWSAVRKSSRNASEVIGHTILIRLLWTQKPILFNGECNLQSNKTILRAQIVHSLYRVAEIKHKHGVGIKMTQNAKINDYTDSNLETLLRIPSKVKTPQ